MNKRALEKLIRNGLERKVSIETNRTESFVTSKSFRDDDANWFESGGETIRNFRLEYAPERLVNWKFKWRRENLPTLLNQLSLPRVETWWKSFPSLFPPSSFFFFQLIGKKLISTFKFWFYRSSLECHEMWGKNTRKIIFSRWNWNDRDSSITY